MRKLTILLALVAVAASSGCCGCGRIRNWFHRGSPCGTTMTPAVLGAPLAMGTPCVTPAAVPMQMVAAPCCEQAPMCPQMCPPMCPPCDPCADPCGSGGMSMGYMGGYPADGACCGDASGAVQMTVPQGVVVQEGTQVYPAPQAE